MFWFSLVFPNQGNSLVFWVLSAVLFSVFLGVFWGSEGATNPSLRLLNALNSEDRGLKVRFSLATIAFDRESAQMSQILSSQGKNAPSNPYPHYLVRLATSRLVFWVVFLGFYVNTKEKKIRVVHFLSCFHSAATRRSLVLKSKNRKWGRQTGVRQSPPYRR